MLVLDTDHMSLLEWGGQGSALLRERLADIAPEDVATTIISFEEQMRGWMAYIARAKSIAQQLEAYRRVGVSKVGRKSRNLTGSVLGVGFLRWASLPRWVEEQRWIDFN